MHFGGTMMEKWPKFARNLVRTGLKNSRWMFKLLKPDHILVEGKSKLYEDSLPYLGFSTGNYCTRRSFMVESSLDPVLDSLIMKAWSQMYAFFSPSHFHVLQFYLCGKYLNFRSYNTFTPRQKWQFFFFQIVKSRRRKLTTPSTLYCVPYTNRETINLIFRRSQVHTREHECILRSSE